MLAVNADIFPVPTVAKPILGLSFVQLYVVPVMLLSKLISETILSLQTFISAGLVSTILGFTVMVKVNDPVPQ